MSTDTQSAHADLAFLKALVDGDSRQLANFGATYLVAGLAFGLTAIIQWLDYAEILPLDGVVYAAAIAAPILVLVGFSVRQGLRSSGRASANPSHRAISTVFHGAGLANIAVFATVIAAAMGLGPRAGVVILIYPAVLFAFQGACWFVVWRLRRRLWMLAVTVGWIASAVAMGVALGQFNIHAYIAIATFDLFVLMALPGAVMLRSARKAAP